jgi:pyruvate/2-oxoglutarate dehydrogenase complex dihydrolipoamide dehydrogenase (E3) component
LHRIVKFEITPILSGVKPSDHGKSLIMEAMDGFVKLPAGPKSGEIPGGTRVGPAGGELIHELAVMPHYHPTLAEIRTCPAEELAAQIH